MNKDIFLKMQQIKEFEKMCMQNGMPISALMEKAGLKSSYLFKRLYPKGKYSTVVLFIGPGNNGGDALVVARELFLSGYKTYIYIVEDNLKEVAAEHLKYYLFIGGKILNNLKDIFIADVIIDGLFGYGLNKILNQKFIHVIEEINKASKNVVALDLPSGMHADFGNSQGACIKATHTFCIGIYKEGLVQDNAVDYIGVLHLIDIGIMQIIPNNLIKTFSLKSSLINIPVKLNSEKSKNLNKYSNGVILLFAGSKIYPGAGILSVKGALASGAGYIQLCCTEELKYSIISKIPDVVCHNFIESIQQIHIHINNPNFSILCGPGLSNNNYLEIIIEKINSLNQTYPCLIIDATSLNIHNYQLIKDYKGDKILTPHSGEFKKMFPHLHEKMSCDDLKSINKNSINKIDAVRLAAKEINGVVLLKGPHTVIANTAGEVFVDLKSTNALARAGCGDVLSGFISGLKAKGLSAFEASCLAVNKQSKTALKLEKKFGKSSVSASYLAHNLAKEK